MAVHAGGRSGQYVVDAVRIAADGCDRRRGTVLSAPGRRGLALRLGASEAGSAVDARQMNGLLLLMLLLQLLCLCLLLRLLLLMMMTPLGHRVERREWLTAEHAAAGGAEIQKLENVRRGCGVKIVKPGRPRRRWRVTRGRWRRTRAERRAGRRAPLASVDEMTAGAAAVVAASVRIAERRHPVGDQALDDVRMRERVRMSRLLVAAQAVRADASRSRSVVGRMMMVKMMRIVKIDYTVDRAASAGRIQIYRHAARAVRVYRGHAADVAARTAVLAAQCLRHVRHGANHLEKRIITRSVCRAESR